jgi:hypothetical protein
VDKVKHGPFVTTVDPKTKDKANKWLTMSMTTGKNREIKKALGQLLLGVSRIIRTKYPQKLYLIIEITFKLWTVYFCWFRTWNGERSLSERTIARDVWRESKPAKTRGN